MKTYTPGQAARILGHLAKPTVQGNALLAGAAYLKGKLAEYPPERNPKPKYIFTSPQERAQFFAKLRAGLIEVPYRRGLSPGSETMSKQWGITRSNVSLQIGNRASYAPRVIGLRQHPYMRKLGWRRIDEIARAEREATVEHITAALVNEMRNA